MIRTHEQTFTVAVGDWTVPPKGIKSQPPAPVHVTLLGNTLVDIIKLRWSYTRLGCGPNPTAAVLSEKERQTPRPRKTAGRRPCEGRGTPRTAATPRSHKTQRSSPRTFRRKPCFREWPADILISDFLASRGSKNRFLQSRPLCSNPLWQP